MFLKRKKEEKKRKKNKREKMHLPRLKTLAHIKCSKNLSRKRVKRVKLTPRVYVMHEKKRERKITQHDYRVQNPLLSNFFVYPTVPKPRYNLKRPQKVCGICCGSDIRMYSKLRVWYCILCCECTHLTLREIVSV